MALQRKPTGQPRRPGAAIIRGAIKSGPTVSLIAARRAEYSLAEVIKAGHSLIKARDAGYTLVDAKKSGLHVSLAAARRAGYSLDEAKKSGFNFSLADAKKSGYTLLDAINAGYHRNELIRNGYRQKDVDEALSRKFGRGKTAEPTALPQ